MNQNQSGQNNCDFLYNAINDIAGNIRFIDTKIALILTSLSVIVGAVLTCRKTLYTVYLNFVIGHIWFLITLFIFIISILLTLIFSILCLIPRYGKVSSKQSISFWFFNPQNDFKDLENYCYEFSEITNIEKNLCKELYNLNGININKLKMSRLAFVFFTSMCFAVLSFSVITCYYYFVFL